MSARIAGSAFTLEVARTESQRARGLMGRTELPPKRGMLFPIDPPRRVTFWMKGMLIPIDMVFVADGSVIAIERDVRPCSEDPCPTYGPDVAVDSVIEIRSGLSSELGIDVGSRVTISAPGGP